MTIVFYSLNCIELKASQTKGVKMLKAIKFLCFICASFLGKGHAEEILIKEQVIDLDLYRGRDVLFLDRLIEENQVPLSDLNQNVGHLDDILKKENLKIEIDGKIYSRTELRHLIEADHGLRGRSGENKWNSIKDIN